MAGLVVGPDFDIKTFGEGVARELPPYAQPLFVRILPAIETTGTFKARKMDLIADGFDPGKIKGPLYLHDAKKGYVKVTKGVHEKILAGTVKV
jgi:fatty-acyl-CoA synthase